MNSAVENADINGPSYVSLVSSVGIAHHSAGSISIIPYTGSANARRILISEASQLAFSGATKSESPAVRSLAALIKIGQSAAPKNDPNARSRKIHLDFDKLRAESGRVVSIDGSVTWSDVYAAVQMSGATIQETNHSSTRDDSLINYCSPLQTLEFLDQDGAVIGGGCGLTREQALRSALGEAAERIIAQTPDAQMIFLATADGLRRDGWAIPEIEYGPRDAYSDSTYIDWMIASTITGHRAAIPAELAYYNYHPLSGVKAFALQHTAGLAAGGTLEEAVWHGLTELLERDAYWITMRTRHSFPEISADLVKNVEPELLREISEAGLKVVLKDISLDWPIRIVHATLIDESNRIPGFSHGVGSHVNWAYAAVKAVRESIQVRTGLIRHCQQSLSEVIFPLDSMKWPPSAWSDPTSADLLSHLFEGGGMDYPSSTHAVGIEDAIAAIQKTAGQVFWTVLGNLGPLQVVRVVVPNCVKPDRNPGFVSLRLQKWLDVFGLASPYDVPILT